ncbi:MAG: VanZ family protein, partial [Muribaculaceae bacterium]|nr:VanZ family protein [Muribaculaceae bacterium]
ADKLIHAIMMGGLSSAILFDYRRSGKKITSKICFNVGLWMIIFSMIDEIGQSAMNLGRTFELMDFLADTGGVILGVVLSRPVINYIFKNTSK